jgi:hypothetical protein
MVFWGSALPATFWLPNNMVFANVVSPRFYRRYRRRYKSNERPRAG